MTDTQAVYVTSDGGYCAQFRHIIPATRRATMLCLDDHHTVMLRTVYADGLTHVIIREPYLASLRTVGEWTYNNRGQDQEIYPDSGIPHRGEDVKHE